MHEIAAPAPKLLGHLFKALLKTFAEENMPSGNFAL